MSFTFYDRNSQSRIGYRTEPNNNEHENIENSDFSIGLAELFCYCSICDILIDPRSIAD